jgi:hypothetical protein
MVVAIVGAVMGETWSKGKGSDDHAECRRNIRRSERRHWS